VGHVGVRPTFRTPLTTTDGRELTLSRYSEPDADQRLLLATLKLQLPKQPPPRIATCAPVTASAELAA
jgi:hypothetical protein